MLPPPSPLFVIVVKYFNQQIHLSAAHAILSHQMFYETISDLGIKLSGYSPNSYKGHHHDWGGGGGGGGGGFIDRRAGSSFRLSIIPGVTLDLFPDGVTVIKGDF